jgi:hypothetical protein
MARESWVFMPHPAHLCVADRCKFYLATYVNGYIVSTVGEYIPDRDILKITRRQDKELMALNGDAFERMYAKKYRCEDIGCDRKYETGVWIAKPMEYDKECAPEDMCCKWKITGDQLDFGAYNSPLPAYEGHMAMCEKWDNVQSPDFIQQGLAWAEDYNHIEALLKSNVIDKYEYDELRKKLITKYCSDQKSGTK